MIWVGDGFTSNFARDMAFDPDTGDVYARRSNDIDKAVRSGDNSTSSNVILVDGVAGDFQIGQKIEFLSNTPDGDLLIYNDRPNNTPGIPFDTSVKVVDTNGVAQTAIFNLIGGQTSADINVGFANYDFDYDETTGTLALMDFANRNVFIFEIDTPTTGLVGDYNGDMVVDAADYTSWRDTLGDSVPNGTGADGNNNGMIDTGDYDLWRGNYGATAGLTAGPSAGAAAAPEPASALLALLALGLVATRRR